MNFLEHVALFFRDEFLDKVVADSPGDELRNNAFRSPNKVFSKGTSLGGRLVCAILIPIHFAGVVGKPAYYLKATLENAGSLIVATVGVRIISTLRSLNWTTWEIPECDSPSSIQKKLYNNACCVIVSPVGQVMQIVKATAGIIHPGFYFKADRPEIEVHNTFIEINNTFQTRISCGTSWPSEHPESSLAALVKCLNRSGINNFLVRYTDGEGTDAGGLTSDFISKTFASLSKNHNLQESVIPWDQSNDQMLKDLGTTFAFFASVARKDGSRSERFYTGNVFNKNYFEGILFFEENEMHSSFDNLPLERILELFIQQNPDEYSRNFASAFQRFCDGKGKFTDADVKDLRDIDNIMSFLDDETDEGMDATAANVMREKIKEDFLRDNIKGLKSLHVISKAMYEQSQVTWQNCKIDLAENLQNSIEGCFSKELLIEKIEYSAVDSEKQGWIEEWIRSKEDHEVKSFLLEFTGKSVVSLRKKPRISLSYGTLESGNQSQAYQASTCGNSLMLSSTIFDSRKNPIEMKRDLFTVLDSIVLVSGQTHNQH